jgi:DNA (cytosine-5)-methyltransferase 1
VTLTALDLFSGAGGLSLGLTRAGFRIVGAVDSWKSAIASYEQNFAHPAIRADIGALTADQLWDELHSQPEPLDVVVGGPPCQGFSIQRIGPDADARNSLVLEFARLVTELAPRAFVMENVTGLVGQRGRALLARFVVIMEAAGYAVERTTVDAADFGVPQHRRRVIVYGWRSDTKPLSLPNQADDVLPPTVAQAIGDLPPASQSSVDVRDPLHVESRMSDLNRTRLALIPPGGGFEDLPSDLRVACHREGAAKIGHRNVYGRLDPDQPAVTITARFDSFTRGKFAHPFEDRNITLREGARLQTFPDDFRFVGNREEIAALIGNAVPPLMAERLGSELRRQMEGGAGINQPVPQRLF